MPRPSHPSRFHYPSDPQKLKITDVYAVWVYCTQCNYVLLLSIITRKNKIIHFLMILKLRGMHLFF
jgi:hypothetical protein